MLKFSVYKGLNNIESANIESVERVKIKIVERVKIESVERVKKIIIFSGWSTTIKQSLGHCPPRGTPPLGHCGGPAPYPVSGIPGYREVREEGRGPEQ